MPTTHRSEAAVNLLRRRLAGESVVVTDESRPLDRELAAAGLMESLHSFSRGDEGHFRLTAAGVRRRGVVFNAHTGLSSPL